MILQFNLYIFILYIEQYILYILLDNFDRANKQGFIYLS